MALFPDLLFIAQCEPKWWAPPTFWCEQVIGGAFVYHAVTAVLVGTAIAKAFRANKHIREGRLRKAVECRDDALTNAWFWAVLWAAVAGFVATCPELNDDGSVIFVFGFLLVFAVWFGSTAARVVCRAIGNRKPDNNPVKPVEPMRARSFLAPAVVGGCLFLGGVVLGLCDGDGLPPEPSGKEGTMSPYDRVLTAVPLDELEGIKPKAAPKQKGNADKLPE